MCVCAYFVNNGENNIIMWGSALEKAKFIAISKTISSYKIRKKCSTLSFSHTHTHMCACMHAYTHTYGNNTIIARIRTCLAAVVLFEEEGFKTCGGHHVAVLKNMNVTDPIISELQ